MFMGGRNMEIMKQIKRTVVFIAVVFASMFLVACGGFRLAHSSE